MDEVRPYGARPVPERAPFAAVVPAALFGAVAVLTVLASLGLLRRPGVVLVVLCVFAFILTCCAPARVTAALAVGGICWLLYNGFAVGTVGELAWDAATDLPRIVALAGCAVLGTAVAGVLSAWSAYARLTTSPDQRTR
ncbi:hypothetical protein [Yinghuangia sp. YIM S09857]|uniref:hypothetical protein n=1 Tax=Yinghuangia sp. YIM S09857 TaxID=3436929 RepID=UPI003F530B16